MRTKSDLKTPVAFTFYTEPQDEKNPLTSMEPPPLPSYQRAIIRPPSANFAEGLTTAVSAAPNYQRALEQHAAYCLALEQCGLQLRLLEPDPRYPDATFVEDTAVLTERCAVLTRPGAPSRSGEVEALSPAIAEFYPQTQSIVTPGTLDGGDVCQSGDHFFIGISRRTDEPGARQLARILASFDYTSSLIDIRGINGLLHLKSGLAWLGEKRLVVSESLNNCGKFTGYEYISITKDEAYAANCVRVNDQVLIAAGYPVVASRLQELDYKTIALDMSEFQKMDGGLSCLSLRF